MAVRLRELVERHRPIVAGVVSGAVFGALFGAFQLWVGGERPLWLAVLTFVLPAVFFGVSMAFLIDRQTRAMGGAAAARAVQSAIATRTLPRDPVVDWSTVLRTRGAGARRLRWQSPALFALLIPLGVVTAFSSLVPSWVGWFEVAIFITLGVWGFVSANRELSAIAFLDHALALRESETSAPQG